MTDVYNVLKIAKAMRATLPHVTTTVSGDVVMCSFPCCPRQSFDPINNGADFDRVFWWFVSNPASIHIDWNVELSYVSNHGNKASRSRRAVIHAIAEVL